MPKSNFQRTADWLAKCGKTVNRADLSVQIGVHLEEHVEFLRTLNIQSPHGLTGAILGEIIAAQDTVAQLLKSRYAVAVIYDHEQALDALSDGEVTANGVAYLSGYDKEGHDAQVLDKNDDKFDTVTGEPVIREGGKIGKREGWTPPDAAPFVTNAIDANLGDQA